MYSTQLTGWDNKLSSSKKTLRIIAVIILIPVIILDVLVFLDIFNSATLSIVSLVTTGVVSLLSLILFLLSSSAGSKKLITTEILPELIKEHTIEDSSFRYFAKSKTREINLDSGLFTRHATVTSQYKISTNKYSIYHATIVHSNGKSSTVDFQGLYFIFPFKYDKRVQIRTMGSANYKKPNLKALKKEKGERYYSDSQTDSIDSNLVSIFNSIKRSEQPKHLYMSLNKKELHVAISKKEYNIPSFKKISNTEIETLKQWLNKQIQITDEILNDISYYN